MLITCTDLSPKYTFYYSSLPVAKVRAEILLSMINARIKSPKRVPAGLVNAWDKYANSIFSSVQFGSVHFQGWLGRQELAETVTAAAAAAAERRAAAMFVFGCLRFGCGSLDDKSLPHALPFERQRPQELHGTSHTIAQLQLTHSVHSCQLTEC